MSSIDGKEVIGGFSLRKPGKFGSPQAIGLADREGGTVTFHKLSTSFHYYFLPSFIGAFGFGIYGIPGIVAGVVLGTVLMFAGKKLKYTRAVKKVKSGKADLSHDLVLKKGKIKKFKINEGKLRKSIYLETSGEKLHILGDRDSITEIQGILV